jgi:hypothetical protein
VLDTSDQYLRNLLWSRNGRAPDLAILLLVFSALTQHGNRCWRAIGLCRRISRAPPHIG